jgi:hypothetical protein
MAASVLLSPRFAAPSAPPSLRFRRRGGVFVRAATTTTTTFHQLDAVGEFSRCLFARLFSASCCQPRLLIDFSRARSRQGGGGHVQEGGGGGVQPPAAQEKHLL